MGMIFDDYDQNDEKGNGWQRKSVPLFFGWKNSFELYAIKGGATMSPGLKGRNLGEKSVVQLDEKQILSFSFLSAIHMDTGYHLR